MLRPLSTVKHPFQVNFRKSGFLTLGWRKPEMEEI